MASWRHAAVVAAAMAVTAACGSTVPTATGLTAGGTGGGDAGLSTGTSSDGGATTTLPGSSGSTAAGGGGGVTGGAGGGATSIGPSSGSGPGGANPSAGAAEGGSTGTQQLVRAPGITATTVFIGVPYSSQAAAGDRAIGAAGAAPSYDFRNVFNSVAAYANTHGGFAGRKLKAIYYDANLTTDANTQDQAACSLWTQDHKVFAMITGTDILDACAEKAGAVGLGGGTASTFQRFPHLIDPDGIRLDRLGQVTVNGLFRAGYFTGKLGLVTWEEPDYEYTMAHGYLPALAAHGIKPTQVAYITVPQQVGALGDMSAAVSSAITKFRTLGIDHVIIQDGPAGVWAGTGLTLEWMDQADSQHYYPRYGQNTYNSPGWDVLPADQMDKAIAIDQSDYDVKFDKGWHANTYRDKCLKIEKDAGYPAHSSNPNDEAAAEGSCDIVFFLQQVLNGIPGTISNDAFVQQVATLGTSFHSAEVYGNKFLPGRRDGGDMVRTEEYHQSCQCMSYMGPPYYAD